MYWSFPQICFPLKMTVGFRRDPSAQMIGMRVAVSQFSFRSANCCCIPWGPICQVLWVHLSRKQQLSSIAKINLGSMLYSSMISWRSLYQWFIVSSLTAPPRTYSRKVVQSNIMGMCIKTSPNIFDKMKLTVVKVVDQYCESWDLWWFRKRSIQLWPTHMVGSPVRSWSMQLACMTAHLGVSGKQCFAVSVKYWTITASSSG